MLSSMSRGITLTFATTSTTLALGFIYVSTSPRIALVGERGQHDPEDRPAFATCLDCHVPFVGTPGTRCSGPGCHGELATGTPPLDGPALPIRYHVVVRKIPCMTCHEEHQTKNRPQKRDVHLILPTALLTDDCARCHSARERTSHARTDEVACGHCHSLQQWPKAEVKHEDLPVDACDLCHELPPKHQLVAGGCSACHVVTTWTPISQQ